MIKPLLIAFLLLLVFIKVRSQEGIPGQVKNSFVQVRDYNIRNKKPVKRPCLLWLPESYTANSNLPFYPLLVFLHDSKEGGGANGTNINLLEKYGPFYFLENKKWNGTAGYGGKCGPADFIVFAMQSNTDFNTDTDELDYAIQQLLLRFRIDERRIIFTGVNGGAELILHYLFDSSRSHQPRLIVPMSVPFAFNSKTLPLVAKRGVRLWAFTFDKDRKAGINYTAATTK